MINIAEILKDCPKGTKLYSPLCGRCELYSCDDAIINVTSVSRNKYPSFNKFGQYYDNEPDSECLLFPSKENRDWSKFQRPFKDGDILFVESIFNWIFIYKENKKKEDLYKDDLYKYVATLNSSDHVIVYCNGPLCNKKEISKIRFATEEEKEKLFDAIKANGYKWNAEAKTLEKLITPKFKVGNIIQDKNGYKVRITDVDIEKEYYVYESLTINGIGGISFNRQDEWELAPNKFDITTLKPFDKVLVRADDGCYWRIQFFERINKKNKTYPFVCMNGYNYKLCVPYEGNEYLLNTAKDCDNYYKILE